MTSLASFGSARNAFAGYSFKPKMPKFLDFKRAESTAKREIRGYEAHLELEAYLDAVEMIRHMRRDNMLFVASELVEMRLRFGKEYQKELTALALEQARILLRR